VHRVKLFILGLRRSGTTIFWETLRQDSRFTCYDEPFNPLLRELPAEHPKRTRRELIALFDRDPEKFWQIFAPIGRIQELQEGFSDRQFAYLRFLLSSGENVVLDTTRCHYKMDALAQVAPDAYVVHLYRPAAQFATSHLAPSSTGPAAVFRERYARARFWSRGSRYNYYGIEDLIGTSPRSLFGQRLAEAGLDPEAVYRLPAAGRLIAYWKIHYDRLERCGPKLFPGRFYSLPFGHFCANPEQIVRKIYQLIEIDPVALSVENVHPAKPAHAAGDPRWRELARAVGLGDESELLV
jgi:hypothetical protein